MLNTEKLESSFSKIANLAKRDGTEAELLVESGESIRLSVNDGKLEKFDSSQSHVGGLRVILGGVEGYCWTESLEDQDLEAAYFEAVENAKFASRGRTAEQLKAEAVELYSSSTSVEEDPNLFNDSLEHVPMDRKIERAIDIERKTKEVDPRISTVPYNSYAESNGEFLIFNTRGVRARQRRTSVSGYAYCLAKQGDESRMAGDSFFTRDASKIAADVNDVAKSAGQKAVQKLGAVSPETGRYPVVIDREVVAEVFGLIAGYFSAKSISERTSIFGSMNQMTGKPETELGKAVASRLLTITDDPNLQDGVGNRNFDSEGAKSAKTDLIRNGVLTSFLTNSTYAKKLGLKHTASASRSAKDELDIGPSNLVVAAGSDSIEDLLASHPRLIYITDFTGYHAGFRAGSGEFGFQSEGELWENGKRVKALCNFVVAGSIRELMMNIEKVSSRMTKKTSSVLAPDLLISSLSVAGV
jgi:PmbA protein